MPVVIKELVITVKANEARQAPVSQQRPEARAQQAKSLLYCTCGRAQKQPISNN